jgi:hypothetical protein
LRVFYILYRAIYFFCVFFLKQKQKNIYIFFTCLFCIHYLNIISIIIFNIYIFSMCSFCILNHWCVYSFYIQNETVKFQKYMKGSHTSHTKVHLFTTTVRRQIYYHLALFVYLFACVLKMFYIFHFTIFIGIHTSCTKKKWAFSFEYIICCAFFSDLYIDIVQLNILYYSYDLQLFCIWNIKTKNKIEKK